MRFRNLLAAANGAYGICWRPISSGPLLATIDPAQKPLGIVWQLRGGDRRLGGAWTGQPRRAALETTSSGGGQTRSPTAQRRSDSLLCVL